MLLSFVLVRVISKIGGTKAANVCNVKHPQMACDFVTPNVKKHIGMNANRCALLSVEKVIGIERLPSLRRLAESVYIAARMMFAFSTLTILMPQRKINRPIVITRLVCV